MSDDDNEGSFDFRVYFTAEAEVWPPLFHQT